MTARTSLALILLAVAAPARGDGAVLVELFTSEGCSSCPPADALLSRIAHDGAGGAQVVTLSEHVDYWDELGWRDRFSSRALTRRQEAYVRRLRLTGPYTPQLVVGGRTDVLGSDAVAARRAIAAAAREATGRIDARLVPGGRGDVAVVVAASWRPGIEADVLVALVQDRATTRV
ncbi:MAG TPA: DUF1223 domain-containing protein, partial [Anaeromyxobacter sp.]|nr:DUF1223 domain-containing protein [Anaeromyxobacter sp.]